MMDSESCSDGKEREKDEWSEDSQDNEKEDCDYNGSAWNDGKGKERKGIDE